MDHLFLVAFYESVWRVFASIVCATILIICCATSLSSASLIAAHIALFFTVLMIRNAGQIANMSAEAKVSPSCWAQYKPAVLMLHFAKAGAGIAAGLYGAALVI